MSGRFDVFSAALTPDRREVVIQPGDTDRRHRQRVGVTGGTPAAATSVLSRMRLVTSGGAVAFTPIQLNPTGDLTRGSPTDLVPT